MDQDKQISKPRVSVIIPVYNTEAYVEEAIRSIMNQTLRDIEIIIIDDGSTDNSLTLIKKLAVEDNRIAYHSQANQGQSVARNVGIEKARGEYIYFMDSDDFLEEEALECCNERIKRNKLDFLLFNANILNEDKKFKISFDYKSPVLSESSIYSGTSMLFTLLNQKTYRCSPCIHFISLKTLQSINLKYFPGIIHEDELFSALLYLQSQRIGYINRTFFHRRIRANSVMTKNYTMKNVDSYLVVAEQLIHFAKNKDNQSKKLVHMLVRYILGPNIYKANVFSTRVRFSVIMKCLSKGLLKFVTVKTMMVVLFPSLIILKRVLVKANYE